MKKVCVLFLLVIVMLPLVLHSQNVPKKGYMMDVGLAPFNFSIDNENEEFANTPIIVKQLLFRKIVSETMYYRIGFNLDYTNQTEEISKRNDVSQSSFLIGLESGFEKHTKGTDKLSPYYGAILGLQYQTYSQKHEQTAYEAEFENCWVEDIEEAYSDLLSGYELTVTARESTQISFRGIIGCDYYFSKNIYLGLDVQYGLSVDLYPQVEGKTRTVINEDVYTETMTVLGEASSINIGKTARGMLHVGYKF